MLAVGSDDPNTSAGGKVQIHEYNEASRFVHNFISKCMHHDYLGVKIQVFFSINVYPRVHST